MLLQKKIERAMKWLNNRNSQDTECSNIEEEKIQFEKSDILALIISALMIFGPIILVLVIILRWALKS